MRACLSIVCLYSGVYFSVFSLHVCVCACANARALALDYSASCMRKQKFKTRFSLSRTSGRSFRASARLERALV